MPRPTLNRGALQWCGEHWINAISDPRDEEVGDQPSAWFSLYQTRYCEAGEGHVLHLVVPSAGIAVICSDNPELRTWVADRFLSRSTVWTPDATVEDASFQRRGATRDEPSWVVEWPDHRIEARWTVTEAPVTAYGPFSEGNEFFTVLFFTMASTLALDGHVLRGQPYLRDIWEPTIGGKRSSSVIALNETLIESGADRNQ